MKSFLKRSVMVAAFLMILFAVGYYFAVFDGVGSLKKLASSDEVEELKAQVVQLQKQADQLNADKQTNEATIAKYTEDLKNKDLELQKLEYSISLNKKEITLWTDRINSCVNKPSDVSKSSCFDRIAKYINESRGEEAEVKSQWSVHSARSATDNLANVQLQSIAVKTFENQQHSAAEPSLYLFCKDRKSTVALSWDRKISQGFFNMTTQFDEGPAIENGWQVDKTGNSLVYYDDSRLFIEDMLDHKTVSFEFNLPKTSLLATFEIEGLRNELETLRDSCGWQTMASL